MNETKVESKYGMKLKRWTEPGHDVNEFYEMTKNFTVSDYFDFSPRIDDILDENKGCQIRYYGRFTMDSLDSNSCYSHFSIQKFLIRQNVCYLIKPIFFNDSIYMPEYKLASGYSDQLHRFHINGKSLNSIDSLYVAVHFKFSDFLIDDMLAANIELRSSNKSIIYIGYREFDQTRLPAPYNTKCSIPPDGYETWNSYGLHKINNQTMKYWNYSIQFPPTFDSSLKMVKLMDYRSFYNETIRNQLNRLLVESNIMNSDYHTHFFITDASFLFQS